MTDTVAPLQDGHAATSPTLGNILQTARLQRKFSVQEIADALNLPAKKIDALEQDDYRGFSGRTYIRGYLLGYAHYVGVETSLVSEAFAAVYPASTQNETTFKPLKAGSPVAGNNLLLTVLTVVVFGLGLAGYLTLSNQSRNQESRLPLSNIGGSGARTSEDIEADGVMGPHPVTETTLSSRLPLQLTPATASNDSVTEPEGPVTAELLFKFAAQSWADIRASNGTKLLYNLQPAGSEVSLSVELPVKIFLGNAPEVQIFYNDELYDQPIRGRIAQFTLEPPDLTSADTRDPNP